MAGEQVAPQEHPLAHTNGGDVEATLCPSRAHGQLMARGPIPDEPEQPIVETEEVLEALADTDPQSLRDGFQRSCDARREEVIASLDCPVIRIKGLPVGTFYILNSPPANGAFAHHPEIARAFEDGAAEVVVCGAATQ